MSRLTRLLALANRPGTEHEGAAARAAAERRAEQEGLRLIELTSGTITTAEPLDDVRADLMRALERIADPPVDEQLEGGDNGR